MHFFDTDSPTKTQCNFFQKSLEKYKRYLKRKAIYEFSLII